MIPCPHNDEWCATGNRNHLCAKIRRDAAKWRAWKTLERKVLKMAKGSARVRLMEIEAKAVRAARRKK